MTPGTQDGCQNGWKKGVSNTPLVDTLEIRKEMQSLLGFANFYRRFIWNYNFDLDRSKPTPDGGTRYQINITEIPNQRQLRQAKTLSEFDFQIVAWGEKWEKALSRGLDSELEGGSTSTW